MADTSAADPRQAARHFVKSVGRKNQSQPTPRELGTQWVKQKDGSDAYGDATGQSYLLDAAHNHAWKKGSIEIDAEKALAKKKALDKKKADELAEKERGSRDAVAPPPETPEQKQRRISMEINEAARAKKLQEAERVKKTDAAIAKDQADAQALNEKMEKISPTPQKSGKPFPGIADMLGNPNSALQKMKVLDKVRTVAWVEVKGKRKPSNEVMDECMPYLVNLQKAVEKVVKQSDRDLKRIVNEHKGWMSNRDVYDKLSKDLDYASTNVEGAAGDFSSDPPHCEAGMQKLISALRFNKMASEAVSDWASDTIASAEEAVYWSSQIRDGSIDILSVLAIAASAPVWGAEAAIIVTTAVTKSVLKGSDAYFAGKPIPKAEITVGFLLDLLTAGFGKWFEGSIKKQLEKQLEERAAKEAAALTIEAQIKKDFIRDSVNAALDILRDVESEELKTISDKYFEIIKKDPREAWSIKTFDEIIKSRFTIEHAQELMQKVLWARAMNGVKEKYKKE